MIPKELLEYPELVKSGEIQTCIWQPKLISLVEDCFSEENLFFNAEQFATYMSYQKYFPFELFPWEKFLFGLHNCTYGEDGLPRWSTLFLYVGRGAGKNGFLSFEDFCLLTPTNGIPLYHIDTFATAEDQAKTTFEELYDIMESNPRLKRFFYWNKEYIVNLQTKSRYRFRTGNAKTKDSGRQGKIDFDEVHQYENYELIDVGTSGLGKKAHPRRTILSSDGFVREGPLDDYKQQGKDILNQLYSDNGFLPAMFCIESKEEIDQPDMWVKANPSLPYMPNLRTEMLRQYGDYKRKTSSQLSFPTKRLNYPMESQESSVTEYKNLLATKKEPAYPTPLPAVIGIDFASRRDFATIGHLTRGANGMQWRCHGFILRGNPDLERIRAPLQDWEAQGLITYLDGVEIDKQKLFDWILEEQQRYDLHFVAAAVDMYRYGIVKQSLNAMGFESGKDGNMKLVRPSDLMIAAPRIRSVLDNQALSCGDNPFFRWCANNVKMERDKHGNDLFEKIEGKSRKTDGFMAFAAAMTMEDMLPECDDNAEEIDVFFA